MKILLVRLGALGDIVHALPVAAALRERFPDAQIDWLVDARYAAILDYVPGLARQVVIGDARAGVAGVCGATRPGAPTWRDMLAAVAAIRRERYDAALDLQGLIKSAAFARLSGATRVVGFDRRHVREAPASWFYRETCDPGGVAHVVDKNLSALSAFGIERRPRRFPIDVPSSSATAVIREWVAKGGRAGYALINPGAAWPNKRWPPERFGEIARSTAERHGLLPVVLWGPGEEATAGPVVESSGGVARIAPQTGIGDLLALSREARLMLSGDTGPLHLAAAVGTPIVALFGPTNPARNGPWDAADISLSRFDDCVCHYRRRCRRSRACIEDISVEDVRGAIDRRLAATEHHA